MGYPKAKVHLCLVVNSDVSIQHLTVYLERTNMNISLHSTKMCLPLLGYSITTSGTQAPQYMCGNYATLLIVTLQSCIPTDLCIVETYFSVLDQHFYNYDVKQTSSSTNSHIGSDVKKCKKKTCQVLRMCMDVCNFELILHVPLQYCTVAVYFCSIVCLRSPDIAW